MANNTQVLSWVGSGAVKTGGPLSGSSVGYIIAWPLKEGEGEAW